MMDLIDVGIVLKCLCGAGMNSDMVNVLFDDKGRVKIGHRPIHCPVCGAIYRHGERLKYELAPMDAAEFKKRRMSNEFGTSRYARQSRKQFHDVPSAG
jgi:hypothetical protein